MLELIIVNTVEVLLYKFSYSTATVATLFLIA